MLDRLMGARILLIAALALSPVACTENSNEPFDPHDLSGFWDITDIGLPADALNATSNNRPPMTEWGLEEFRKTKTRDASVLSNGVFPDESDWNDPVRWCDPTGFPRIMWSPTPAGMRFAQADEEVIQFFENNRVWRDIWTDGRELPVGDPETRWYGYAVGHWEGDTFVVNSSHFTEGSWLDQYGSPHSEQMTVEERYRRVDHDHLEMVLNITDPVAYVGTWNGDKKIFQLVEQPTRSAYKDLPEDICVWSETRREIRP